MVTLPYWLARLTGRADGPHLRKCVTCKQMFDRNRLAPNWVQSCGACSPECAGEYGDGMIW